MQRVTVVLYEQCSPSIRLGLLAPAISMKRGFNRHLVDINPACSWTCSADSHSSPLQTLPTSAALSLHRIIHVHNHIALETIRSVRRLSCNRAEQYVSPGLPTCWSFGWPYGGQNACISSPYLIISGAIQLGSHSQSACIKSTALLIWPEAI